MLLAPFCGWLERDGLFGPELEFAVFVDFGFGLLATRDFDHVFENALAYFVDRFSTIDEVGKRVFDHIVDVANGTQAKAEIHKHREFQFWAEQTVSL